MLTDEDEEVDYDFDELDELAHAYAVTIHRSQGSEYPAVVIPLTTGAWMMLQRNLLYTGVTRAKKLVVLVGSRRALAAGGAHPRRRTPPHRPHPPAARLIGHACGRTTAMSVAAKSSPVHSTGCPVRSASAYVKQVAQIEPGWMPSFAASLPAAHRPGGKIRVDGHDVNLCVAKESVDNVLPGRPQPSLDYDAQLNTDSGGHQPGESLPRGGRQVHRSPARRG